MSATKAAAKPAAAAAKPARAPRPAKKHVHGVPAPAPESFLKKRKAADAIKAKRAAAAADNKKKKAVVRREIFKRAEKYVKEYRAKEKQDIRLRRQAKNSGNFYVAPQPKILFVIRIRGIMGVSPKARKILQLLRLRQVHNGVFIKLNKATQNMLFMIEPFVTYGEPNLKSVRE